MRLIPLALLAFSLNFSWANAQGTKKNARSTDAMPEGGGILEIEGQNGSKPTLSEATETSRMKKRIRETLDFEIECQLPQQKPSVSTLQVREREKGTLLFEAAAVNITGELIGDFRKNGSKRGSPDQFDPHSVKIEAEVTAVTDSGMKPLGSIAATNRIGNSFNLQKKDPTGKVLYSLKVKVRVL